MDKQHAVINYDPNTDEHMVKDLGSLNGVSESISTVRQPALAQSDIKEPARHRLSLEAAVSNARAQKTSLCARDGDGWSNSGNQGPGFSC